MNSDQHSCDNKCTKKKTENNWLGTTQYCKCTGVITRTATFNVSTLRQSRDNLSRVTTLTVTSRLLCTRRCFCVNNRNLQYKVSKAGCMKTQDDCNETTLDYHKCDIRCASRSCTVCRDDIPC